MAQYYDIDIDRQSVLLTPSMLRKVRFFAFLKAATMPLWTIYRHFRTNRQNTLFLLKYNTSKKNVETALNLRFETDGIYIVNNGKVDNCLYLSNSDIVYLPDYVNMQGTTADVERVYLSSDTWLDFYIDAEIPDPDFFVMVPAAINETERIESFTRLFTLPSFRFEVISY